MFRRVAAALVVCTSVVSSPVFAQTPDAVSASTRAEPSCTTSVEPLPSFRSLFTGLATDFRRLPSAETGIIIGALGAGAGLVGSRDARITLNATRSAALDTLFEPGETLGGGVLQAGGAMAVYAVGRLARSAPIARVGADLVRAQMVNAVLTQGIKLTVGRTRPDGSAFSFPSGHTSSAFATAAVLQRHFGWATGVPAYALATYIAGSRLQENKHFASDVIFGAAIGVVAGRTVTIGHGRARFALAPIAAPGGGGIGLTWQGAQ